MSTRKNQKKSNFATNFLILFVIGVIVYIALTKESNEDTYKIKSANGENGYKASFINLTGQDADDKKIELSDDYWTDGKFK